MESMLEEQRTIVASMAALTTRQETLQKLCDTWALTDTSAFRNEMRQNDIELRQKALQLHNLVQKFHAELEQGVEVWSFGLEVSKPFLIACVIVPCFLIINKMRT